MSDQRPFFTYGIPFDEYQLACHISNEGLISQAVQRATGIEWDRLTLDQIDEWIHLNARRPSASAADHAIRGSYDVAEIS